MRNAKMSTSVCLMSVFLMVVVSTVGSQHAHAQCVALTPAQMLLDASTLPEGEIGVDYIEIVLAVPGPVDFLPNPGSVVALRIAPPEMLNVVDDYVADVDYSACIDASTGSGTGNFLFDGSYTVEVEYSGGNKDLFIVQVNVRTLGKCFGKGKIKEFICPTPPKTYAGDDVDQAPETMVTSVQDLVTQVCTDAGTGPIDLVLVDHGCEGGIAVDGENVSNDAADAANLAKFCEMKGKLKSVTLLSCSTGHGQVGCDFLETLSSCFNGVPVTAYTGNVVSWTRNGTLHWGSYGDAVTKSNPPSLPHFTTINIFETDVAGDSGPVDTFALGIGIGNFIFEAVPAGVVLDGMTAQDLPAGLSIDADTGAISGTATDAGITHVGCIVKDAATGEPWDILWWKIIVDDGTIPHFKEKHHLTTGEFTDSGPIDTGVFDPPGPYSFEVVPPGQILGGITTDKVPNGLSIDPDTGAVTGATAWPGQYHVLCVVTRSGTWDVVAYLWWDFVIDGPHIPAVSQWGLMVMTLLALTAGTVVLGRRRRPAAA